MVVSLPSVLVLEVLVGVVGVTLVGVRMLVVMGEGEVFEGARRLEEVVSHMKVLVGVCGGLVGVLVGMPMLVRVPMVRPC